MKIQKKNLARAYGGFDLENANGNEPDVLIAVGHYALQLAKNNDPDIINKIQEFEKELREEKDEILKSGKLR